MISIIAVLPGHLERDDEFSFYTIDRTLALYVDLLLSEKGKEVISMLQRRNKIMVLQNARQQAANNYSYTL